VEGSIGDFCDFVAGLFESLDPKRGRKKDRVIRLVLQHLLPLLERAWRFGTLALGAETRAIINASKELIPNFEEESRVVGLVAYGNRVMKVMLK